MPSFFPFRFPLDTRSFSNQRSDVFSPSALLTSFFLLEPDPQATFLFSQAISCCHSAAHYFFSLWGLFTVRFFFLSSTCMAVSLNSSPGCGRITLPCDAQLPPFYGDPFSDTGGRSFLSPVFLLLELLFVSLLRLGPNLVGTIFPFFLRDSFPFFLFFDSRRL